MGSSFTKTNKTTAMVSQASQTDIASSSFHCICKTEPSRTPNFRLLGPLPDPRSATKGIIRTPIFVKVNCKDETPKYLETDIDEVVPNNLNPISATPTPLILTDPRSPTDLLERTPISVFCSKSEDLIDIKHGKYEEINDTSLDGSSSLKCNSSCPEVYVDERALIESFSNSCEINNSCPDIFVNLELDNKEQETQTVDDETEFVFEEEQSNIFMEKIQNREIFVDEIEIEKSVEKLESTEIFVDQPSNCAFRSPTTKDVNQMMKRKLSFTPDSPSMKVDRKPLRLMNENVAGRLKSWPNGKVDSTDVENTPPKHLYQSPGRPHKALWDHENTLLI